MAVARQPIEQRLMGLSSFNEKTRALQRLLVGHADDVVLDGAGRILSLAEPARARHVTAGVYFLKPVVYSLADARGSETWNAFRAFLAALLAHGHPLFGYDVGDSVDVDRPEDISAAERLLRLAGSA